MRGLISENDVARLAAFALAYKKSAAAQVAVQAIAGAGIGINFASFRMFWAVAARRSSSLLRLGLRGTVDRASGVLQPSPRLAPRRCSAPPSPHTASNQPRTNRAALLSTEPRRLPTDPNG